MPGIAFLDDDTTRTGNEAARARASQSAARAHELLARPEHRSSSRGRRASRARPRTSRSRRQKQLLGPYKSEGESVLLAVPAGYSREQLALLLGVINETGVRVAGLVDAALAACSLEPAPARVLHLDLELHQAILTVLEYSGGERSGLKRSRYEIALRHGVLDMQQTLMQFIAETFIRKTRFDPLHDASTEQRLVDQLPALARPIARAGDRSSSACSSATAPLEIEIERAQLIAAARAALCRAAAPGAGRARRGHADRAATRRRASQRFRACSIASARCAIARSSVLPRGAAALGTLQHEAAISRPPTRSRSSITCRSRAPPAVKRGCRAGSDAGAAAADAPAVPGPRVAHFRPAAGDRLVRRRRSAARWCCRAPRPACRVPIARSSGATAPS